MNDLEKSQFSSCVHELEMAAWLLKKASIPNDEGETPCREVVEHIVGAAKRKMGHVRGWLDNMGYGAE